MDEDLAEHMQGDAAESGAQPAAPANAAAASGTAAGNAVPAVPLPPPLQQQAAEAAPEEEATESMVDFLLRSQLGGAPPPMHGGAAHDGGASAGAGGGAAAELHPALHTWHPVGRGAAAAVAHVAEQLRQMEVGSRGACFQGVHAFRYCRGGCQAAAVVRTACVRQCRTHPLQFLCAHAPCATLSYPSMCRAGG